MATAHWGAMQLSADWLITTGHLTLLALSVLFCSSEDELPESGVNQGILTARAAHFRSPPIIGHFRSWLHVSSVPANKPPVDIGNRCNLTGARKCRRCAVRHGGCRWMAADTEQDRHVMSPDLLSTLRLSRSDAQAPRRRRSLSTQSHPPVRRSPVDALRAGAEMPTALSRPRVCRHRGAVLLACRPSSRSAPTYDPHSTRCQPVPNFPRLRALALFGRRPPQRVDSLLMPASENLHKNRRELGPLDAVNVRESGNWKIRMHLRPLCGSVRRGCPLPRIE